MSQRIRAFLHRTTVVQAMLTLAWATVVFGLAFGTALTLAPEGLRNAPTFQEAFQFAPPYVWGIGYLTLATLTALALQAPRKDLAPFPIWGLALLTCAWGAFTIPTVAQNSGAITAVIVYPFAAFIMLIVGTAIDQQEDT